MGREDIIMSGNLISSNRALSAAFARNLPKYFTAAEVHQIIYTHPAYIKRNTRKSIDIYRKRFFCWFLWQTGARIGEALDTVIADIEPWASVVHIRTLKQKKPTTRTLPKTGEAGTDFFKQVDAYIEIMEHWTENPMSKLFDISYATGYRWIRKLCKQAGLDDERAHPHTFRHSFAVNCVLHGISPAVLRIWLGHSDINKTMIYARVVAQDTSKQMEGVEF